MDLGVRSGGIGGAMKTVARISLAAVLAAFAAASAHHALAATDGDIVFSISSPSVAEGGSGETAALPFAVTLNRAPGRQVTVDWAAAADPGTAASGADYTAFSGGTLTFSAADTSKTVEVTVTGDALDEPDETIRIALSNPSGAVLGSAATGVGTITDDDSTPTLVLMLSDPLAGRPNTIRESGAGNATTVTARILRGHRSGEAITVTVSAASAYAGRDDIYIGFSLSAARTLTIAAGQVASAGVVTITATDDAIKSATNRVRVSGTVAGGYGLVAAPAARTLTIADEDSWPSSALALAPASISESGGVATVTATLSHPSARAVTIAVSATASTGAVAGDFTLSTADTLTVAAGQTTSAGVVTVTAVGNGTDSPDKQVTVKGSASGTFGAKKNPPDATLRLRDDDGAPTVSLVLSSSSIAENGGVATVSAALGGPSSEAVTVTVAASGEVAGDFGLSGGTTLTIAANATTSTGTVTITASDNDVDAPDKRVTVYGTATGGNGIAAPPDVTLTLADDEALPTATLVLSDTSISEGGGISTVTATLSGVSSEALTLTVSAAGANAAAGDFTLSAAATLTIAAGETASAGVVTVTANNDDIDSPNQLMTVSGTATGGNGVARPSNVWLTLTDDDARPQAALAVMPDTISENGGRATVTATLSGKSSAAISVVVNPKSGFFNVVGLDRTIVIAAGQTTNVSDTVTVEAVDDDVHSGDRSTTVTGNSRSWHPGGISALVAALTLADDETLPTVALALSDSSISETSGVSTVTATLTGKSSAAVTVTVGAAAGSGAVAADFTLSSAKTLTIAAGATTSTGLVTVTANGNAVDSPNKSVTVSGTAAGGNGVAAPPNVTLTLEDDETLPTVALVLSDTSISETSGISTVTAALSGASSAAVTVTVAAAAGTGAVAADFTLSSVKTLTIVAGETTSAGLVTVTANGNAVDSPNKSVTVSGTAAGGNGVVNPPNVTLTLEDDEEPLLTVGLVFSPTSISETGGVATVTATLSVASSEAVTVTALGTAVGGFGIAVAADFTQSGTTLTIAANATTSTGLVTVTAVDNDVHLPGGKTVAVVTTAASGNEVAYRGIWPLAITEDDALPTVALALSDTSISETGGVATVTATLTGKSNAAVTVTVAAAAGSGAVGTDFTLSSAKTLTIAARSTTSAGVVTVTANGNDVDSPNKSVTVSGAAAGGNGVAAPPNVTLTLEDDDALPTVALVLTPPTVGENGGISTVTATLTGPSSEAVTVTVAAAAGSGAVAADFDLSSATILTIAAGSTTSAGLVTVTANGNDVDSPNKSVTVSGAAAGGNSVANPPHVTLTLEDDDALPTVALALSDPSISETGGVSTVTATLTGKSSEAVTITVGAAAGSGAVGADFALSTAKTLTIAAGETTSAGLVTVTANGNTVDSPNKSVTVSCSGR